jgi:cardiolipin synthase
MQALSLYLALFEPELDYHIEEGPSAPLDSRDYVRLLELVSDSQVCADTVVEPLPNGEVFYEAELEAMRQATRSIHIEAYIFQKGKVTGRILDVLTRKAREGVKVRIVLDAIGSFASTWNGLTKELTDAGGRVAWYHPLNLLQLPRINNRTHREIVVIDGQIAFVGGAGFADHWQYKSKKDPRWRDDMFRIEGGAVAHVQATFAENWLEATGEVLLDPADYLQASKADGQARTLIVNSSPSAGRATNARILFQTLLASARKSIHITTPYFVPDQGLRKELLRAVNERGVDVRVIVPGKHHDHILTRRTSRRLFGTVLQGGCKIYEYKPAMIHTKVMVVDGVWSVIGSTNMDPRSFGINDEVNLAVCDQSLAEKLENQFALDIAESEQVSLGRWKRRPWYERVSESLGWIIERQQ